MRVAPRSSSARAVSARNGCASRNLVFGPTAGSVSELRGGRKLHRTDAQRIEQPDELVFDHIGQRSHHKEVVLARS